MPRPLVGGEHVHPGVAEVGRDQRADHRGERVPVSLVRLGGGARTDGNSGITYSQLESGTVSYAYADLGGDGVLDLVVAVVQPDGAYQVIGIFSTDGDQVTSLMNGDLLARSWWRVLDDGRVLNRGSGGATTGSLLVYRVEGGALVPDASATMTDGSFNAWSSDPDASVDDPQQVWQELSELPDADLDWQALEDFSPAGE